MVEEEEEGNGLGEPCSMDEGRISSEESSSEWKWLPPGKTGLRAAAEEANAAIAAGLDKESKWNLESETEAETWSPGRMEGSASS